jgi:hypothetical protein
MVQPEVLLSMGAVLLGGWRPAAYAGLKALALFATAAAGFRLGQRPMPATSYRSMTPGRFADPGVGASRIRTQDPTGGRSGTEEASDEELSEAGVP